MLLKVCLDIQDYILTQKPRVYKIQIPTATGFEIIIAQQLNSAGTRCVFPIPYLYPPKNLPIQ